MEKTGSDGQGVFQGCFYTITELLSEENKNNPGTQFGICPVEGKYG